MNAMNEVNENEWPDVKMFFFHFYLRVQFQAGHCEGGERWLVFLHEKWSQTNECSIGIKRKSLGHGNRVEIKTSEAGWNTLKDRLGSE